MTVIFFGTSELANYSHRTEYMIHFHSMNSCSFTPSSITIPTEQPSLLWFQNNCSHITGYMIHFHSTLKNYHLSLLEILVSINFAGTW